MLQQKWASIHILLNDDRKKCHCILQCGVTLTKCHRLFGKCVVTLRSTPCLFQQWRFSSANDICTIWSERTCHIWRTLWFSQKMWKYATIFHNCDSTYRLHHWRFILKLIDSYTFSYSFCSMCQHINLCVLFRKKKTIFSCRLMLTFSTWQWVYLHQHLQLHVKDRRAICCCNGHR